MPSENQVEHVNCGSAEQFLNALSPRSKYLEGPISEAQELLLLLSHQEITGATVYPGYAGAAKAVLETRYHF